MKAAARPNAHQHIMAIAAFTLGLAGRLEEANTYKAKIRERVPDYAMADFLAAFRYSPDAAALFKQGGQRIGNRLEMLPTSPLSPSALILSAAHWLPGSRKTRCGWPFSG